MDIAFSHDSTVPCCLQAFVCVTFLLGVTQSERTHQLTPHVACTSSGHHQCAFISLRTCHPTVLIRHLRGKPMEGFLRWSSGQGFCLSVLIWCWWSWSSYTVGRLTAIFLRIFWSDALRFSQTKKTHRCSLKTYFKIHVDLLQQRWELHLKWFTASLL